MNNKARITKLEQAMLPQLPDFMVVVHHNGEPEPQEPEGYKGTFVILSSFRPHAEEEADEQ